MFRYVIIALSQGGDIMTIGDKIKLKRIEKELTLEELGKMIGVSRATIQRYESGVIAGIPSDKIEMIADILKVSPAYLMGWEDEPDETTALFQHFDNLKPIEKKKFPILGEIACGTPIFADEKHETYIEASKDIKADFCLICKGDSMIDARIHDGDVVFIRKQAIVNNGEIAAVIIDNEATLKKVYYYKDKNLIILKAANSSYEDMIYINDELNKINILGKAVCFQSLVEM